MLLKESTRILSSSTSSVVWGLSSPTSCITSSCLCNSSSTHRPRARRGRHLEHVSSLKWDCSSTRCYASISDYVSTRSSAYAAGYTWPTSLNPTPYEILAHSKDSQYNKAVFYELVKIYHPDRNHAAADSAAIPHSVRLERYRLVVSANEILSDPKKRREYDLYGAGWDGHGVLDGLHREADRSWRTKPGNASANATWEDWERWRQQKNGNAPPTTPVFVSNEVFVFLLCFCMVLGAFAEVHRADSNSISIVAKRDQKHATVADNMARKQNEQTALNRHERIERFIRERNSWNVASPVNSKTESLSEGKRGE